MNQAEYTPDCPVCGHTGRKQITTRESALLYADSENRHAVTVFKCLQCGTAFTKTDRVEPADIPLARAC